MNQSAVVPALPSARRVWSWWLLTGGILVGMWLGISGTLLALGGVGAWWSIQPRHAKVWVDVTYSDCTVLPRQPGEPWVRRPQADAPDGGRR